MKSTAVLAALYLLLEIASPALSRSGEPPGNVGCLSGECHRGTKRRLEEARVAHPPASEGSCHICHESHGDEPPPDFSLKRPIAKVCFTCHEELGEMIESYAHVHTLILDDRCAACHAAHGSDYTGLMKRFYPPLGKDPLAWLGATETCLQCHEQRKILAEGALAGTGFRNADKNLHSLHMFMESIRKCETCHEIHASGQPFHIRSEVPFGAGKWELPLQFTKLEDGGRCVVGCHRTMEYERGSSSDNRPSSFEPNAAVPGRGGMK